MNSWQSPISGESGWGQFHEQFSTLWNDVDPSAATAYVTCPSVPNGTSGVKLRVYMLSSSTAGRTINVRKIQATLNTWIVARNPSTSIGSDKQGDVPLDSNKQFAVFPSNADVDHVSIYQLGYYI